MTKIPASSAARHNFDEALKFYVDQAKGNPLLPGTLKRPTAVATDQVHVLNSSQDSTADTREVCRDHAAGKCRRGKRCAYYHPPRPGEHDVKCSHCGKPGHLAIKCFRRIREEKAKQQEKADADSTNVTVTKGCSKCDCQHDPDDAASEFAIDDAAFVTMSTDMALAVASLATQRRVPDPPAPGIIMILDGASTCVILQEEKYCYDLRDTNRKIRVGGKNGKNVLAASKIGTFPFSQRNDGRTSTCSTPALVVPGFGCNILPECLFLKRGLHINKTGTEALVVTNAGDTFLRADALKVDKSWLFYAEVQPLGASATAIGTTGTTGLTPQAPAGKLASTADIAVPSLDFSAQLQVDYPVVTYALKMEEGELESHKLLPFQQAYEQAYKTRAFANSQVPSSAILLWHKRFSHRSMKKVCDELGIPYPGKDKLPICNTCLKCKSRRQPLTGSDGLQDGIRPGYAWAWDHMGPFAVKTWGGNCYASVKIDIKSGKIKLKMTNTTGNVLPEWKELVLQLQNRLGHNCVGRLTTDSATPFLDSQLALFNKQRGIIHAHSRGCLRRVLQPLRGRAGRNPTQAWVAADPS